MIRERKSLLNPALKTRFPVTQKNLHSSRVMRYQATSNAQLDEAAATSKNKELTDSLYYAERIQKALGKDPLQLNNYFTDSFIIYRPKDIVSGDFYWFHRREYKVFLVAADCTGHGVPGALMSVIGNNLLREAIVNQNLTDPGRILQTIDKLLGQLFNLETSATADGMDLALTVFDFERNEISFAGAFRPLVRVRNQALTEIKGSRFPIGLFDVGFKNFVTQRFDFEEGDQFYIFSDGYNDQFGGPNNKKLTRKRLYHSLTEIDELPMSAQKKYLEEKFQHWKGNGDQTDDVLLIGIKI